MPKRNQFFTIILALYLAALTFSLVKNVNDSRGVIIDGTTVLTEFWEVQFGAVGQPILLTTMTLALFTAGPAFLAVYIHNNHSFYNVQQRIGYRRFLEKGIVTILRDTALLSAASVLYQLLLILVLVGRLPSNVALPRALRLGLTPFNDNTLLSLAIFTILAAVGWGIFSVFVFSLGLFISKNSLFLVLGAIIGTTLIVGPALLLPLGQGNLTFARILAVLMPSALFAPGQITFSLFNGNPPNVYLTFLLSAALYLSATWFAMTLWLRQRRSRG